MPIHLRRPLLLLLTLALGFAYPALERFGYLVRPMIMTMLLVSFAKTDLRQGWVHPRHLLLALTAMLLALGSYFLLRPFDLILAQTAALLALTPTATSAPVIVGLLGGEVGFVTSSVILSNLAIGIVGPVLIGLLNGRQLQSGELPWMTIASLVLIPLAAAQLLRKLQGTWAETLGRQSGLAFGLWLGVLVLIAAQSAAFLKANPGIPPGRLASLAGLAGGLCLLHFKLGQRVGGKALALEAGQSLGQKNTVLAIWLALHYLHPLVALGPTFYVIFHNIFNGWQLFRYQRPAQNSRARRRPIR